MLGDSLGTDDYRTDLVSLNGGFYGNNDDNFDCSSLGVSLGSTEGSTFDTD